MYQIGEHILAFQGHPEFTKAYSHALIKFRKHILGEKVYARGIESLEKEIHDDILAEWILRFLYNQS